MRVTICPGVAHLSGPPILADLPILGEIAKSLKRHYSSCTKILARRFMLLNLYHIHLFITLIPHT